MFTRPTLAVGLFAQREQALAVPHRGQLLPSLADAEQPFRDEVRDGDGQGGAEPSRPVEISKAASEVVAPAPLLLLQRQG